MAEQEKFPYRACHHESPTASLPYGHFIKRCFGLAAVERGVERSQRPGGATILCLRCYGGQLLRLGQGLADGLLQLV